IGLGRRNSGAFLPLGPFRFFDFFPWGRQVFVVIRTVPASAPAAPASFLQEGFCHHPVSSFINIIVFRFLHERAFFSGRAGQGFWNRGSTEMGSSGRVNEM